MHKYLSSVWGWRRTKPINWLLHGCPAMFIWQQRSPGMKSVLFPCSFPIALHCIIPDNTSICHLALFSFTVSIFWIPPSWKPALNLVLFVFHNHLQRALRMGAGCCCSQMEPATNVSAPQTGLAPTWLHYGQADSSVGFTRPAFAFFIYLWAPVPAFLRGDHLMEFPQEPQMCCLARLLPLVCSQPLLAKGLGGDEGSGWCLLSWHATWEAARAPTHCLWNLEWGRGVQGVTFLLKVSCSRGGQIGLWFSVDPWCYKGLRTIPFMYDCIFFCLPVGFWCPCFSTCRNISCFCTYEFIAEGMQWLFAWIEELNVCYNSVLERRVNGLCGGAGSF